MIKNLVISLLFLLPILGFSQQLIMVYGTVTNSTTGAPLVGQTVYITTDSSCSSFYSGTAVTNANGFYADTITVGLLANSCNVYVSTYGCGVSTVQTITITPSTGTTQLNLQLACGGNPTGCSASFVASDSVGWVMCSNLSSGTNGSGYVSSWVVDGVGSGNAQNPAFQLAAGSHVICLTISDNTGCSSTYCDSVYVQAGGGINCQANFSVQTSGNMAYLGGYATNTGGAAVTYFWDLGNGTTSSLQSPAVNYPNGVYNVCLTISTSNNCTSTTCQTIAINNVPATDIHGWVFSDSTSGGIDTLKVWLIQYDSLANTLTAVDSQIIGSNGFGYYNFTNVSGSYLVKAAIMAGPNYATNLPTYYDANTYGVLYWSSATQVQANANDYNIYLVNGVNPGGPGFIGGLVSQGANKMSGAALPNATVLLLDVNDNPIAYTYSDANGNFSFANLAYGTYKVHTEVLNKVTYPVLVTISATHPTENGVSVEINSTYVAGNVSAVATSNTLQSVKVYPNPASDNAVLNLNLKESANVEVSLQNIMGQVVMTKSEKMTAGEQAISFSMQNLPKGIYILKVNANGAVQEMKVVKE